MKEQLNIAYGQLLQLIPSQITCKMILVASQDHHIKHNCIYCKVQIPRPQFQPLGHTFYNQDLLFPDYIPNTTARPAAMGSISVSPARVNPGHAAPTFVGKVGRLLDVHLSRTHLRPGAQVELVSRVAVTPSQRVTCGVGREVLCYHLASPRPIHWRKEEAELGQSGHTRTHSRMDFQDIISARCLSNPLICRQKTTLFSILNPTKETERNYTERPHLRKYYHCLYLN